MAKNRRYIFVFHDWVFFQDYEIVIGASSKDARTYDTNIILLKIQKTQTHTCPIVGCPKCKLVINFYKVASTTRRKESQNTKKQFFFKIRIGIFFVFGGCIPLFGFMLAQGLKRCHDTGNSGWLQLIPGFFFWMMLAPGDPDRNKYGPSPMRPAELPA
jgi:uncharacterized membrane protein YhaH (DUF805 family)